jgi:hypothetical protein
MLLMSDQSALTTVTTMTLIQEGPSSSSCVHLFPVWERRCCDDASVFFSMGIPLIGDMFPFAHKHTHTLKGESGMLRKRTTWFGKKKEKIQKPSLFSPSFPLDQTCTTREQEARCIRIHPNPNQTPPFSTSLFLLTPLLSSKNHRGDNDNNKLNRKGVLAHHYQLFCFVFLFFCVHKKW